MRILLVTTNVPVPYSRNGNAQRSTLLMQALRAFGEVDLFLIGGSKLFKSHSFAKCKMDPQFNIAGTALQHYGRCARPWGAVARVLPSPLGGNVALTLAHKGGDYLPDVDAQGWVARKVEDGAYDMVVSRYLRTALYVGADRIEKVPSLVDVDDMDWRLLASATDDNPWSGLGGRLGSRLAVAQVERLCRRALPRFRHVWTASADDARLLGLPQCSVLPNIPFPFQEPEGRPVAPQESARLLFVGELGWGPNRGGLDRFLDRVWPSVRSAFPGAVFEIVGQSMTDALRERWGRIPGVISTGFVDVLGDAYARATFTVAPIYQGAGTNIKVLESLSRGRTTVTTEYGLRGFGDHLRHRDSVWCGHTDEEFAQGCIELIRNPDLRQTLEKKGRETVAQHYSPEVFDRAVREAVEPLV